MTDPIITAAAVGAVIFTCGFLTGRASKTDRRPSGISPMVGQEVTVPHSHPSGNVEVHYKVIAEVEASVFFDTPIRVTQDAARHPHSEKCYVLDALNTSTRKHIVVPAKSCTLVRY